MSAQMASPLAQGLFAHAIGESGGAFASKELSFPPLEKAAQQVEAYLHTVVSDSSLTALRASSSEAILKLGQNKSAPEHLFEPDTDGYFLPQSVPAIFAAGKQARVPVIAGWNMDESHTKKSLPELAAKEFPGRTEEFLRLYHGNDPVEEARAANDFGGDNFLVYSTWAWLDAQVKGGSPAYRYLFAQPSPGDPFHPLGGGAFHSDEIEYVFGNLDFRKGAHFTPDDYKVSELMQTYWTNFAKTGNPNGLSAPQWPVYDAAGHWQVMRLSPDAAASSDPHRARYLFLQQVWGIDFVFGLGVIRSGLLCRFDMPLA